MHTSTDTDVALTGFVLGVWHFFALSWLLLAYPTGRLPGRREQALLALVGLLCAVRSLSRLLLYVPPDGTGCGCVTQPVRAGDRRALVRRGRRGLPLAARRRAAPRAGVRRGPLAAQQPRRTPDGRAGAVATAAAVVAQVGYDYVVRRQVGVVGPGRTALFLVVVSLRVATAAAFVIGLRRQGAARSAVVDLVGGLEGPDSASPDRLAAALRRALGDPSLELVPWSAAEQSYVDPAGNAGRCRSRPPAGR